MTDAKTTDLMAAVAMMPNNTTGKITRALDEKKLYFKIHQGGSIPTRGTEYAAGYDLRIPADITIKSGECVVVDTLVSVAIPPGYYGRLAMRSSIGKLGLTLSGGVIDSDYRGNIGLILINGTIRELSFKKQERIAQIIIEKIYEEPAIVIVDDELPKLGTRGTGGFGSTGKF